MKVFKIGVTGHRAVPDPRLCGTTIRSLVQNIYSIVSKNHANVSMVLLSPLAEGADRITAQEWLKFPDLILECPLPLEVNDYLTDFKTDASKQEFLELLAQSRNTKIMAKQNSRSASYKAVGHYVVDHSDLLLVIWDGQPPQNRSGTAAIVHYARSVQKPLYWVHSEYPERVTGERINKIHKQIVNSLDTMS